MIPNVVSFVFLIKAYLGKNYPYQLHFLIFVYFTYIGSSCCCFAGMTCNKGSNFQLATIVFQLAMTDTNRKYVFRQFLNGGMSVFPYQWITQRSGHVLKQWNCLFQYMRPIMTSSWRRRLFVAHQIHHICVVNTSTYTISIIPNVVCLGLLFKP